MLAQPIDERNDYRIEWQHYAKRDVMKWQAARMKVRSRCDAEYQCITYCIGEQLHRRHFEASMEDVPHSETFYFYAKGLEAIDLWIGRCVHKGVSPHSDCH